MKVKSQLIDAQLEIKAGTPTTALKGNVVINTSASDQVQYSDGSATRTVVNTDQAQTLTNKTVDDPVLTGDVSGDAFLDEDDLSTNSPTKLASQQSIKAYVDALESYVDSQDGLLIPKSVATTKGDILAATASSVITRLGVGSDGQVLTAASGQSTGLQWSSVGNLNIATVAKTTTYTAQLTDDVILCSTSGGAWTLTLPTAVGNTGKRFYIKYTASGFTYALTVQADGSEVIDSSNTTTLDVQGETLTIVAHNGNWETIDRTIPRIFASGAGNGGTSITGASTAIDWTEVSDSLGIWSTNTLTAPKNGIYTIIGQSYWTASVTGNHVIVANGSSYDFQNSISSNTHFFNWSGYISKGNTLTVLHDATGTLNNLTTRHWMSIVGTPA